MGVIVFNYQEYELCESRPGSSLQCFFLEGRIIRV